MVRSPTTMDLVLGGTRLKIGTDGSRRRGPLATRLMHGDDSARERIGQPRRARGGTRRRSGILHVYNTRAFVPTSLCLVSCFYNTDVGRKFLPGGGKRRPA